MIPVKYQNHRGHSVDLNAHGIVSNVSDIVAWELDAEDVSGRVVSLKNALTSFSFKCATYSNTARSALYDVPSADVEAMKPGRLYVDDWYLVCYISGASQSRGADMAGKADYSITVSTAMPFWRRDTLKSLTERLESVDGLDYAYDYAYDYGHAPLMNFVDNRMYHSADMLIRLYGPCSFPTVVIAGNTYGVNANINQGDRIEIDTSEKTVRLVKLDGTVENAFADAYGDYSESSGSYIFERLPHGQHAVSWSGTFNLDVVVVERANEPRWW